MYLSKNLDIISKNLEIDLQPELEELQNLSKPLLGNYEVEEGDVLAEIKEQAEKMILKTENKTAKDALLAISELGS